MSEAKSQMGMVALTALVLGNMVGSGVFMLPAALAPYGGTSVLAWGLSACGAMLFGLVIARLARRRPAVGGPYAWTRDAFGDLPAFLVGWGYWVSCWTGQAAIAIAMAGYLGEFFPFAAAHPASIVIVGMTVLCAINIRGVREAGFVQVLTTLLKVLPLVAIALFGFSHFEPAHFEPFNPTSKSLGSATMGALALTLWAFQGFESAAVASEEARDAQRNVPRATLLGIGLATALYVAATLAVMGLEPPERLAASSAPFADAAASLWGPRAGKWIAVGAFISCLGALNGWILVAGRMPLALARDALLPAWFARESETGTPARGLVVSTGLACLLVLVSYEPSLVEMFTAMTLLATLSALLPLVVCALAEMRLSVRERQGGAGVRGALLLCAAAVAYGLLTFVGAGIESLLWGAALLVAGLPIYWLRRR